MAGHATATGGQAVINVFDGRRTAYSGTAPLLVTVIDGNQKVVSREFHDKAKIHFSGLPFFDNLGDNYTFLVSCKGYTDAGFFPVKISPRLPQTINLMILPKDGGLHFAQATWPKLAESKPHWRDLFASGAASAEAAARRYSDLEDAQSGEILACLLNLTAAMEQIHMPERTALDYFRQIMWDDPRSPMQSDRVFAWADAALVPQLEQAEAEGAFARALGTLHPGATRSYKQVEFGEANVQLTLHENDRNAAGCIKVEVDIDYYRDICAHLLLEVAVNTLGSITNPRTVYQLRWIAGRRASRPEFDPLYTVEAA